MVSIKQVRWVAVSSVVMMLSACSSGPSSNSNEPAEDIYAQLKTNTVQYANQEVNDEAGSPAYVLKNITNIRAAYFQRKFDTVKNLCGRVIHAAPDTTEAYYWLARVAIDENDYDQAYNMSTKALTLAKEPSMKAELKRMQVRTQMGADVPK